MRFRMKSMMAFAMSTIMLISQAGINNVKADDVPDNGTQQEVDWTQAPPLLVTEVVSDNPAGKRYTYTEVYNNSDAAINFSDYTYFYCYTGGMGSGKIFGDEANVNEAYKSLYVGDYSTKDVIVEPGKTLVLWQNENPKKAGCTLADFNNYYGTDLEEGKDIISVPYTGIHDSAKRGFFFGTDEDSIVVKAWSNEKKDEIPKSNPDKLAFQYEYSGSDNLCEVKEISAATPGTVSPEQIPAERVTANKGDLNISVTDASVDKEGNFNIKTEIPFEGTKAAMFATVYYRQKSDEMIPAYRQAAMTYMEDGKTFTFKIPAKDLYAKEVEWYIKASNGTYKAKTEEKSTLVSPKLPSDENAAPFYITEVGANEKSTTDSGQYTYFEVYNQSDKPINLAYYKILYYYDYPNQTASQSGKVWSVDNIDGIIEPGKAMVFWLSDNGTKLEQFNNFYGTDLKEGKDIVHIQYSGLHSSEARWIRFGTSEDDAFTLAGFNQSAGQITSAGKAIQYAAPHGENSDYTDAFRNESIPVEVSEATPGTVSDWQKSGQTVTFGGYKNYPEDDGKAPTLKVNKEENLPVPTSVNEGEILKVMYDVDLLMGGTSAERVNAFKDYVDENNILNYPGGAESLKRRPYLIGTRIYYRLDDEAEWTTITEKKQWRLGHYLMQIPADILLGHNKITFKVAAYTLYGVSETEENTVKINPIRNNSGKIRLNVKDDDIISGTKTITANDGRDNKNISLSINEQSQTLKGMLEDGASFVVQTSDMDNYFKNAVTAPYNGNARDIITILSPWCEQPASRVIKIDNKYFSYNQETDCYDVKITLWAGDSGTPFEEVLYPAVFGENHEDYKVSGLKMRLSNGKTYLPTKIEPDNAKTNTDTGLEAIHTIGDSSGMETHLTASFSIPAEDADAAGVTVDTTKLEDGAYTITAENGNSEERNEAVVIVDNSVPQINLGIKEGSIQYNPVVISADDTVTDTNGIDTIVTTLDGKTVELPMVIEPHSMKEGKHILTIAAKDVAGNVATKSVQFETKIADVKIKDNQSSQIADISADLSVDIGGEKADVTFLEGKKLTTSNNSIVTSGVVTDNKGQSPYQIFTVNTGETNEDDTIYINWTGKAEKTDENHILTMFAKNIKTDKWEKAGQADDSGNIKAEIKAEPYVKDSKATLLVQVVTKGTIPKIKVSENTKTTNTTSWDGTKRPDNYDFALAWQTDTQYYSESFPYHYDNMNRWIVDNAEDWKIKYVLHTGDIVDDVDMTGEWINADKSMRIFDEAGIPYGVLGGNHDVYAGAEGYGNYWKYFGEDRFKNKDYYGGSYKNNLGHYDLITENGQDLIILYMSWDIYTEEINWMNDVLAKYPDRKAIIALHRYANVKMATDTSILDYTGKLLQSEVVAKNPNVIAVLNGHYHGSSIQTDGFDDNGDGIKERIVYQICTDYQSDPEGGSEYIKFLYFDLDKNKIYVNSYSPYRNDFNYYDAPKLENNVPGTVKLDQDIVELEYNSVAVNKELTTSFISADLRTTKQIGSIKNASGNVTYKWSGLKPNSSYGWYAKVTNDKSGISYTEVTTFRTNDTKVIPDDSNSTIKPMNNKKLVVGKKYTIGKINYKVKSFTDNKAEVIVTGAKVKKNGVLVIPKKVLINGVSCRITEIGKNAFKGNKKLKKVKISSAYLSRIGKNAFSNCKALKQVTINSPRLKYISAKAFYKDRKLSNINIKSAKLSNKTIGAKSFGKISNKAIFTVPSKSKKIYRKILKSKNIKIKVK